MDAESLSVFGCKKGVSYESTHSQARHVLFISRKTCQLDSGFSCRSNERAAGV